MEKVFIMFGPQGSGKGTQAKRLSESFGLTHISTGELFRDHMKRNTDLGKRIAEYMNAGKYVPDDITNMLIQEIVSDPQYAAGVVFDGYPRTLEQAEFFHALVHDYVVINLVLTEKEAVKRLVGRRQCKDGHIYHIVYHPPQTKGVCDIDGYALSVRQDDTPESIQSRLSEYAKKTRPVLDFYEKKHKLITVDGTATIDDVYTGIREALKQTV